MIQAATLSDDGLYRYDLIRQWAGESIDDLILWVMLNPSMADDRIDDPTVRKCIGFSQRWGFGALAIVNRFALRSPVPSALVQHDDPVGPMNEQFVRHWMKRAGLIVGAWGASMPLELPKVDPLRIARSLGKPVYCLGKTKSGEPRHPGRIGYDTHLELLQYASALDRSAE